MKTIYVNTLGIISTSNETGLFPESIEVPSESINKDNSFNFAILSNYLLTKYPNGYKFENGCEIFFDTADECFNF